MQANCRQDTLLCTLRMHVLETVKCSAVALHVVAAGIVIVGGTANPALCQHSTT